MYLGPERRQYFRKICKIDIASARKSDKDLQTVNLSESGLCIFANSNIKKGSLRDFEFGIPESQGGVKIKARSVWSHKEKGAKRYRIGFRFVKVSEEDLKTLRRFIYSRRK